METSVELINIVLGLYESISKGDISAIEDIFSHQVGVLTISSDHVIFDTDTPYTRIDDQISKIERLKLSDKVKEHIFGLNIGNGMSVET